MSLYMVSYYLLYNITPWKITVMWNLRYISETGKSSSQSHHFQVQTVIFRGVPYLGGGFNPSEKY